MRDSGTDPSPPTNAPEIHIFSGNSVAFDDCVLPRELAFDVDSLTGANNDDPLGYESLNLGWSLDFLGAQTSQTLTIHGVNGIEQASGAMLTLDYSMNPEGGALTYALNGNPSHVQPWPKPDANGSSLPSIAVPVPLSDIVTGTNTVVLSTPSNAFFASVDLVLVGAGGLPK